MGKDVIIALDFPGREETLAFLDRFTGKKPFVKIGMELFYAEGPQIVREIKRRGHKIFLDLKLCDIPNTVKGGMRSLSQLDVDMTNLHAFGTIAMMEAALEGLTRPDGTRPLLIAVTQLTSTDQMRMEKELLIEKPLPEVVMHYAQLARTAGLDGVVCSPWKRARYTGAAVRTLSPSLPACASPAATRATRSASLPRKRPANSARTTSSSAAPSPKRKTRGSLRALPARFCRIRRKKHELQERIARDLLSIGAVFLRPEQPFTWASGIKSPVYCDNRLTLTAPQVRLDVEIGLAETIKNNYPDCEC